MLSYTQTWSWWGTETQLQIKVVALYVVGRLSTHPSHELERWWFVVFTASFCRPQTAPDEIMLLENRLHKIFKLKTFKWLILCSLCKYSFRLPLYGIQASFMVQAHQIIWITSLSFKSKTHKLLCCEVWKCIALEMWPSHTHLITLGLWKVL